MNCVVELADNGRQQAALIGMPGLVLFRNMGIVPIRGWFAKEGTLTFYVCVGNQIVISEPNTPFRTIATIGTFAGPVWMDDNGTQLFINDGATALIYTYSTGIASTIVDPDYPVGARGGVFLSGRFWVYTPPSSGDRAGRVYSSDIYNGLAWDGLNFFTPAARPDGIVSIERRSDDLTVLGLKTIEWWAQGPITVSGALGFQPSTSANSDVGGVSERGASIVNQSLFLIGHERSDIGIYEVSGYQVKKISPPAIDEALSKLPGISSAVCCSYAMSGHQIYQITVPGVSGDQACTWIYDVSTQLWSRRSSVGKPYYRGLLTASTLNQVFVSDAFNGNIYRMDASVYADNGEANEFEIVSTHLLKGGDSLIVHKLWIDCETGLANSTPPGDNPQAIVQISKDGGHVWGQEHYLPLGKVGEYTRRAVVRRIGSAKDIAIKFRIIDPIPRRVTGAYLILEGGNA